MERRTRGDISYLLKTIIVPIGMMALASFLLGNYVIDIPKTISEVFHVSIVDLPIFSKHIFKCVFLFIVFFILYRLFFTKDKVFADGVNGKYPIIVYSVARLLGYKKVSLVHMPIPLQFKIINSRIFSEYEPKAENYQNKTIKYNIEKVCDCKSTQLNIVIYDTYQKDSYHLPESIKQFKTVALTRNSKSVVDGQRVFSDNLLKSVRETVNQNKDTKVFNLLLYTNPYTNIKLYHDVFNTGNDEYQLNVYYADEKTHDFTDKKEVIKC